MGLLVVVPKTVVLGGVADGMALPSNNQGVLVCAKACTEMLARAMTISDLMRFMGYSFLFSNFSRCKNTKKHEINK